MTDHIYAYLIDCIFSVCKTIHSLPPYHGARWSAWLRYAARHAQCSLDSILLGLLPLRSGQIALEYTDEVILRLIVAPSAVADVPRLLNALQHTQQRGEFGPHSLRLIRVKDCLSNTCCTIEDIPHKIHPLIDTYHAPVIDDICHESKFILSLITPLRLTLPAGEKSASRSGIERFCSADWFSQSPAAITHMLGRVRGGNIIDDCGQELSIRHADLSWVDMRYNALRGIALGGLVGDIYLEGQPTRATAQRLILGQYLGAGKNGRFGLGFWQIKTA